MWLYCTPVVLDRVQQALRQLLAVYKCDPASGGGGGGGNNTCVRSVMCGISLLSHSSLSLGPLGLVQELDPLGRAVGLAIEQEQHVHLQERCQDVMSCHVMEHGGCDERCHDTCHAMMADANEDDLYDVMDRCAAGTTWASAASL
jgi:hypothetical protein